MKKILIVLSFFLSGCVAHSSGYTALKLETAAFEVPSQQKGCGWMSVEEEIETKILMLSMGKKARQFNKSLFYCCPGTSGPEPVCYETQWLER